MRLLGWLFAAVVVLVVAPIVVMILFIWALALVAVGT